MHRHFRLLQGHALQPGDLPHRPAVDSQLFPECQVVTVPVADGGEGTVECFVQAIQAPAGDGACQQAPMASRSGLLRPKRDPGRRGDGLRQPACPWWESARTRRPPPPTAWDEVIRHAVESGCEPDPAGPGRQRHQRRGLRLCRRPGRPLLSIKAAGSLSLPAGR